DADELIVFRHPVRTTGRPGFDLSRVQCHRKIRDRAVFSFTGAVRHNALIRVAFREINGSDGLRKRANLVNFDKDRVTNTLVDTVLEAFYVGNKEIVTNELHVLAYGIR